MDEEKLRSEIQKVIAGLEAGWNNASGEEFARYFETDAEFVNIYGSYARGQAAIGDAHEGILHSIYSGSRVAYAVLGVRELAEGIAVAHVSGVLTNGGRRFGRCRFWFCVAAGRDGGSRRFIMCWWRRGIENVEVLSRRCAGLGRPGVCRLTLGNLTCASRNWTGRLVRSLTVAVHGERKRGDGGSRE